MGRNADAFVKRRLLAAVALAAVLASATAAEARTRGRARAVQPATRALPSVSQPVVQSLPDRGNQPLNAALARLARNPRDADALISAGNAALAMGDVDAAVGFFTRADEASPGNPRVKAGLAGALVRSENPFEAIPLFEAAERAGALDGTLAADRGLAYDLVGDNATAQRYYRLALAHENSSEVTRRLALSFAMAGDRRLAEATLSPLLQRQDKAAWRTRAFALAILGEVNEAVAIAEATLPRELAAGISPYLRYMPRLTPAQQAAAANFGHFPRASEIGHDDPRIAQYAPSNRRRPTQASADATLVPMGEPLGRGRSSRPSRESVKAAETVRSQPSSERPRRREEVVVRTEPRAPEPVREQTPPSASALAPFALQRPVATPAPAAPVAAPASTLAVAEPARPPAGPATPAMTLPPSRPAIGLAASAEGAPRPGFDLASLPVRQEPAASPAPPPAAAPEAPAPAPAPAAVSVADAFSGFAPPEIDVAPASGAVDMRRIAPSRAAVTAAATAAQGAAARAGGKGAANGKTPVKPAAKPAPPAHPSRIWVQVATGRDKRALAFDWRRMTRESAATFRGKDSFVSAWGQTNRLLTGPFPTTAAANAYLAQLRRADIDGAFLWTSPAGQVVDELAVR